MSLRYPSRLARLALLAGTVLAAPLATAQPVGLDAARLYDTPFEPQFGTSVSVQGTIVAIGAPLEDGPAGEDQGAVYLFDVRGTNYYFIDKLWACDARAGDRFGSSVDIDSTRRWVIVGAPNADGSAGIDQGAAYLFTLNSSRWSQAAQFSARSPQAGALFGASVAIADRLAVVGEPGRDRSPRNDEGAAHILQLTASGWGYAAVLTAELAAGSQLGFSVDTDGRSAFVGAPGHGTQAQGAALVFAPDSASRWQFVQGLVASDAANRDGFGYSLAVNGDTLAIGAPRDDAFGADDGSVYVFRFSSNSWRQRAKLSDMEGVGGRLIGSSVAITRSMIVAGAPGVDAQGRIDQGAIRVWTGADATWTFRNQISSQYPVGNARLGHSVAISGSLIAAAQPFEPTYTYFNTEGGDTVTVAPGGSVETLNATLSGNALSITNRVSIQHETVGPDTTDGQGPSLDLSGDIAVAGVPNEPSPSASTRGAAYLYQKARGRWWLLHRLQPTTATLSFGNRVAIDGQNILVASPTDVFVFEGLGCPGSRVQRLVLPAPVGGIRSISGIDISGTTAAVSVSDFENEAGVVENWISIFSRNSTDWQVSSNIGRGDGAAAPYFGSVALSGQTLVTGTFGQSPGARVYAFLSLPNPIPGGLPIAGWFLNSTLQPAGLTANSGFGSSVAISPDASRIAVGAPHQNSRGAAFTFRRNLSSWISEGPLTARSPATNQRFGASVALTNDRLIVGSNGDGMPNSPTTGLARLFWRSPNSNNWQAMETMEFANDNTMAQGVAISGNTFLLGGRRFGRIFAYRLYCPGDFDHDGDTDNADIWAFMLVQLAGHERADFDDSGAVNPTDLTEFNNARALGCP